MLSRLLLAAAFTGLDFLQRLVTGQAARLAGASAD
jgi:hypothetical protein